MSKTFSVKVTGCTLGFWQVLVASYFDPNDTIGAAGMDFREDPVIDFSPELLTNDDAGKTEKSGRVKAVAFAWDQSEIPQDGAPPAFIKDDSFSFRRYATWLKTFNASPEPVKKGKKIKLSGTPMRVDWNASNASGKAVYAGHSGRAVKVS